ncbi:MAG: hypothetical protein N2606_05290 [Candidatus Omnitrophica bacterium]|nr:hypothetical protein [Candidatus Omnitrophota bacterium]
MFIRLKRLCLLLGVAVFVIYCDDHCLAEGVFVKTDKDTYYHQEIIEVTVTNKLPYSIFSFAADKNFLLSISNVEKRISQYSWDAFRASCVEYEYSRIPPEIPSGSSVSFKWKPLVCLNKQQRPLEKGRWRFTLIYQIRKDYSGNWVWRTTKSNEFIIE